MHLEKVVRVSKLSYLFICFHRALVGGTAWHSKSTYLHNLKIVIYFLTSVMEETFSISRFIVFPEAFPPLHRLQIARAALIRAHTFPFIY